MDIYVIALIILASIAVMDLAVGVINDAVNFLNSSIGSRVASLKTILLVASLGILAGVLFSSGMMEVARKGIFHPQFFTMPELIMLFMAVMVADILVLDLFNTYGLPTSTTVSIVFELLGAAVALSILKIIAAGDSLLTLDQYINSAKALSIIGGILLSVVVAFTCGAVVQFVARLIFTFNYERNLKKFGGIWGGLSIACIALFILLKGMKGAVFITPEISKFIKANLAELFLLVFAISGVTLQALVSFFNVNIFKPIVLLGTFSLALAFAANDLVNFVGVPIAGYHAYVAAHATANPLTASMAGLAGKVPSSGLLLLACGGIMVLALVFSRKARTVIDTSIGLSSQDEENEKFDSSSLSRGIVRLFSSLSDIVLMVTPRPVRKFVKKRFVRDAEILRAETARGVSFDLVRASTGLVVASIVVSFATSMKLPLSTTYVTFMVAMGASLADRAWGRETAVYRVSGVLTVIGGWFMTAILASLTAAFFCTIIYYFREVGVIALLMFSGFILWKTHSSHREKIQEESEANIYNLRKITDASDSIAITFKQTGFFIANLTTRLDEAFPALFQQDRLTLKAHYRARIQLRKSSSIIAANVLKSMRLLHRSEASRQTEYPMIISILQSMADSYRDIVRRSYSHVRESHKSLLSIQVKEITEVQKYLIQMLRKLEAHFAGTAIVSLSDLRADHEHICAMIEKYTPLQNARINEGSSKTRLSILYFALMGSMQRLARQSVRLFEIYDKSLTTSVKLSA